jgi:hypothetical protein
MPLIAATTPAAWYPLLSIAMLLSLNTTRSVLNACTCNALEHSNPTSIAIFQSGPSNRWVFL